MFYDKFKELCDLKGISVSKATSEIGLSNSTATKWKKTGATPDSSTIAKAASYFEVPTDYFMDDVIFGDSLENIIKEESERLGIAESELKKAFLQRRGSAKMLNRESVSEYFDSVYKKAPAQEGKRDFAQNHHEEDMLLLARHMAPIPEEDRQALKEQFKSSIDLYLKAKGISGTDWEVK